MYLHSTKKLTEHGFNRYMVECEYVHKKESDDMRKSF